VALSALLMGGRTPARGVGRDPIRMYLVALLGLLLSGTFELDACNGAFVHSASRLLQRVHLPAGGFDSSCALQASRGLAPRARCPWGPVMQASGGSNAARKRTGLGHQMRETMSEEQLSALRSRGLKQASEQRIKDQMLQRRQEFEKKRVMAAAQAAQQRAAVNSAELTRNNRAAAVLAEAVRTQPIDVSAASQRGAQQPSGGGQRGAWDLLKQAIAGGKPLSDEQMRSREPAKAEAAKTSATKKPAAKAKPAAAPAQARFHELKVESPPTTGAAAVGDASDAGSRVTVVEASDVWTHDTPMPRLKRTEELRECMRICALPLRGVGDHEDAPFHPEEVAVQQVRLTGRRWFRFLEEEDLFDVGKDPARFPAAVRARYLKEIAIEGKELVTEEEAIAAMKIYMNTRDRRDIARSVKYVEKLANVRILWSQVPSMVVVYGFSSI
jgi:hypothetical protein